jgi:hypothetical protein
MKVSLEKVIFLVFDFVPFFEVKLGPVCQKIVFNGQGLIYPTFF